MPGFDRTGPGGIGPMTGWGRGRCNPSGSYEPRGPRGFFGPGYGRGRGRGWCRGATGMPGWGRMYPPPRGDYYGPSYSQEDELAVLKEEAAGLKEELNAIEQRLSEIETRQEG